MNSMEQLLSVLILYITFNLNWRLCSSDTLSDFTEPTDVAVIEETKQIKLGKNGMMPENLDFKLNLVHGSKPVALHLNRNGLGNEAKQVAVVRRYRNGTLAMVQEHIPKVKNVALYQDNSTYATFTVSCEESVSGQCSPVLLGSLNIEGEEYEFHPLEERSQKQRRKRSVRPGGRKRWLYAAYKKTRKSCNKLDSNISHKPWKGMALRLKQRTASYNNNMTSNTMAARKNQRTTVEANGLALRSRMTFYLKLAVFIDYEIYMRWYNSSLSTTESQKMQDAKSNIRMYFAHVVNGIDIRYNNIEHSDIQLRVVVSEYIIADHPYAFDWMYEFLHPGPGGSKLLAVRGCLQRFVEWKDMIKDQLPPHDHVMLFTGHDLFEETTNDPTVTGYAHVRTVCTPKSASINEDHGGFGGITTATHELGHSLGSNHDGIGNPCPAADQYIMTALGGEITPQNKLNPWRFSDCSIQYFMDYIEELEMKGQNCMREEPFRIHEQEFQEHIRVHPGQRIDPNTQCRERLGKSSYYGWGGGLGRFADICTNMACKNGKSQESFNLYYAARGTSCGSKRWCIDGKCVFDEKAPTKEENCVHGDSKKPIENSSCDQLTARIPANCYKANYSELCCESCKKANTGKKGCEYGDKLASCMLVRPQPHLCYDKKNEGICCLSCSSHYTGIKGCEYGDRKSGCDHRLCHLPDHKRDCCLTCRPKGLSKPKVEQKPKVIPETTTRATVQSTETLRKPIISTQSTSTTANKVTTPKQTFVRRPSLIKPQRKAEQTIGRCQDEIICRGAEAIHCYNDTLREACCLTCRSHETGVKECMYGDKDERCPKLIDLHRASLCKNYGNTCCKSCKDTHSGKAAISQSASTAQNEPAKPNQRARPPNANALQQKPQTISPRPKPRIKFFPINEQTASIEPSHLMRELHPELQNKHSARKPQNTQNKPKPKPRTQSIQRKSDSIIPHSQPQIKTFKPNRKTELFSPISQTRSQQTNPHTEQKKIPEVTKPKPQNKAPEHKTSSSDNNINLVASQKTWTIKPNTNHNQENLGPRLRLAVPGGISFRIGKPIPNVDALHIRFKPKSSSSSGQNFRQHIPSSIGRQNVMNDELKRRQLFQRVALILSRIKSVLRG